MRISFAKSMRNLKPELTARDNVRKVEDEARESLIKPRKTESIAQTQDEESEQLRSACDRLRNYRNEVQDELDDLTERYDELVKGCDRATRWGCAKVKEWIA